MALVVDKHCVKLSNVKNGQQYIIEDVLEKMLSLKLMEMGCMKGMRILKQRTAPLLGPVLIKVLPNGNLLALRYEEAEKVLVFV